jgi:hypothetical protein
LIGVECIQSNEKKKISMKKIKLPPGGECSGPSYLLANKVERKDAEEVGVVVEVGELEGFGADGVYGGWSEPCRGRSGDGGTKGIPSRLEIF